MQTVAHSSGIFGTGDIYFCTFGNQWILPKKAAYIFMQYPREIEETPQQSYDKLNSSRRIEVKSCIYYLPHILNIGANIKTKDANWDCLLWVHLYFGPNMAFPQYMNPSGNMEAPY